MWELRVCEFGALRLVYSIKGFRVYRFRVQGFGMKSQEVFQAKRYS